MRYIHAAGLVGVLFTCGGEARAQDGVEKVSTDYASVSVEDLVRQAVIGDPMSLTWNERSNRVSVTSPDGTQVAVVVRRGNPEQDTNDAELEIYRIADLFKDPVPKIVAKMSSEVQYQPMAYVRWLSDSKGLLFAGTNRSQHTQVYRVDLRTSELKQITHFEKQLLWYDVSESGNILVALSESMTLPAEKDPQCVQHGCRVTAETLDEAQYGSRETILPVEVYDLGSGARRLLSEPASGDAELLYCLDELKGSVSPDGRFVLRMCTPRQYHWPTWWLDYTADAESRKLLESGANGFFGRWIIYDLRAGTSKQLSDAPYMMKNYTAATPSWIDGGKEVVISGILEPLPGVSAKERVSRAAHYAIAAFDPVTLHSERIAQLDARVGKITDVELDERSQQLSVDTIDETGRPLPRAAYRRRGRSWTQSVHPARADAGRRPQTQLSIAQSLNDRPLLVATDTATNVAHALLDPNPWLAQRALGHVEAIHWKSKDGRDWNGGLYYPTSYKPGTRYPLVLQTHGFNPGVFSLYGIARNFVAQPLAGNGMFVLQVAENIKGALGAQEWDAAQAGYEAAIDHLDALGLIDKQHVGIQGWSRTGPHVGYTLTHSGYPFAAGVFTETADFGWWWYLLEGGLHGENQYGPPPFGEGLAVWQKMSPSFNLERVHTPMLLETGGVTGLWDWYVGLRRLHKPVEYWALYDSTHDVFKVGERMTVNQLVVDWFRFWLKGETDAVRNKADQYQRWTAMREQEAVSTTDLSPKNR